jgi:nucleoside-diphosphate-sugar epimerase
MVHALAGPPDGPRPVAEAVLHDLGPGVAVTHGEISDVRALAPLVRGVTTVVHLAGPASVADSFFSPAAYGRAHTVGVAALLEACRGTSVRRIVHVSSAEVYGQPARLPVVEDDRLEPLSPYGAAKLGGEAMMRALAPTLGIAVVVLRPFSVYGPRSRPGSVVATVLRQATACPAVEVHDLRPIRDYVYVEDVAAAVAQATAHLLADTPDGGDVVETYNVGSGVGVSVEGVASLAIRLAARDVPLRQTATTDRPTPITRLVADTERATTVLGWKSTTSLEDGLRAMLAAGR